MAERRNATETYVQTQLGLYVPKSLVDAKGDLIVGTADDTVARKAAGTNGTTLSSDSAQSDGLAWVNRLPVAGYSSGRYYNTPDGVLGTVTPTINQMRAIPFPVWKRQTFDRIAAEQSGGGVATCVGRLGIYADNGSGLPGALVLDAGTIDLSTAAALKTITISQTLDPGIYWLSFVGQVAASVAVMRNYFANPFKWIFATTNPANYAFSVIETYTVSSITGALPNPFGTPADAGANSSVGIYLRAA